jgi:hypothetical protein
MFKTKIFQFLVSGAFFPLLAPLFRISNHLALALALAVHFLYICWSAFAPTLLQHQHEPALSKPCGLIQTQNQTKLSQSPSYPPSGRNVKSPERKENSESSVQAGVSYAS